MSRPEILAPVGNRAMFDAALAAGADAVYLAGKAFGARAYSKNFTDQELKALFLEAHQAGVQVYLTVNTLLKEEELGQALDFLGEMYLAGLDAVIVQDLGLLPLLKTYLPDLPLHASTQMSVTSLAGAKLLEKLGFQRLVLGRESSKAEAQRILDQTKLEVEVFVHGSLCVSLSGQCLLSSFAGGRSGNRGRCAQPCRKTYQLLDQEGKRLGQDTFLSPRDLCTLEEVQTFQRMGVTSIKIEGRMKKPDYVYAVVSQYKRALAGLSYDRDMVSLASNRPFTQGFFFQKDDPSYSYRKSDPSGLFLGTLSLSKKGPKLVANRKLHKGESLRIVSKEQVLLRTLTQDLEKGQTLVLESAKEARGGSKVYLISSPRAEEELQQEKAQEKEKIPLSFQIRARAGAPLQVLARAGGKIVQVEGDLALAQAQKQALTREDFSKQFGKLGNTPFLLETLDLDLASELFLPIRELNALRRKAVQAMEEALFLPKRRIEKRPSLSEKLVEEKGKRVRPKILLETALSPSSYGRVLSQIDGVLLSDLHLLGPWKETGAFVLWKIPMLLEEDQWVRQWSKVRDLPFDGYYAPTINEFGYLSPWIGKNPGKGEKLLFWGPGFNLYNSFSKKILGDFRPQAFSPSLELSLGQLQAFGDLSQGGILSVYGPITGMVLKHDPLLSLSGSKGEEARLASQEGHFFQLEDGFGKRLFLRHPSYTEVLSEKKLDLRPWADQVLALSPSYLHLRELAFGQQGPIPDLVADWWDLIQGDRSSLERASKAKPEWAGHFLQAIE